MNKTLRDAAARVKTSEGVLADYDRETERLRALSERARKKLDRLHGPATFALKDAPPKLVDIGALGYVRNWNESDIKPRDTLIEELVAGGRKVSFPQMSGIPDRALKSTVAGLREWTAVDTAAMRKLDRRIEALQAQRDALIVSGHAAGKPFDPHVLAGHVVTVSTLRREARDDSGYGGRFGPEDWRRRSLESNLGDAKIHQRFVSGDMDASQTSCPCHECIRANSALEAARKEAARVAALPKVTMRHCPCGKVHRSPLDRGRGDYAGDHWDDLPFVTCPTTKTRYIYQPIADKEKAARDKAAAKELRDNGIQWTCPGCQETRFTLIEREYYNGNPDYQYVSCDVCEQAHGVNDVTVTKYRNRIKKEAA